MSTEPSAVDTRLALLEKLGDPLPRLDALIDWESFRPVLARVYRKKRKSPAGRKPYDVLLMFRLLVLQHLYNLSDEQTEYQVRDRLSFMRFVGLTLEDKVPDARTIWLFRERLKERELVERLFERLLVQIDSAGFHARKGQILDASIVAAPRQRNTPNENAAIKAGEEPPGWADKPDAMRRQKDTEARWTKKHGRSHYGYKNHVCVDVAGKFVRRYFVSDAAVHDSLVVRELLDPRNTSADVWADSAYRSEQIESLLEERSYRSHISRKGQSGRPLGPRQKAANRTRAKVRARVEHTFAEHEAMGGKKVRTIGLARAWVKIGLMNLVGNLRRLEVLTRRRAAALA